MNKLISKLSCGSPIPMEMTLRTQSSEIKGQCKPPVQMFSSHSANMALTDLGAGNFEEWSLIKLCKNRYVLILVPSATAD